MAEPADPRDWAEAFKRSPEQIDADRKRVEAEIDRLKEQDTISGGAGLSPRIRSDDPRPLAEVLESALKRVQVWDGDRRQLPCVRAMHPQGAPDGYLSARRGYSQLSAGKEGCDRAGGPDAAGPDGGRCPYAEREDFCPQALVQERRSAILHNMSRAGVADHEYKIIRASISSPRVELKPHDSLQVVRAFLARGSSLKMGVQNGAEIDPLSGEVSQGTIYFTGSDSLLVLGGNNGRGKTVAACYAISKAGGRYMVESLLSRKGLRAANLDEMKNVPGALVIDHVGLAEMDDARTPVLRLLEIVDRRASAGLLTILCGNFDYASFAARYKRVVLERIKGFGLMVLFGGESLRVGLRGNG